MMSFAAAILYFTRAPKHRRPEFKSEIYISFLYIILFVSKPINHISLSLFVCLFYFVFFNFEENIMFLVQEKKIFINIYIDS